MLGRRSALSARTLRASIRAAASWLDLRAGPDAEIATRRPDVDDEQLGGDEEDDERLDHGGEVGREIGIEDRGIELPRGRADLERGEQQRGEEDSDGAVAAEQGDGDAGEADEVRAEVARVDRVLETEDVQ